MRIETLEKLNGETFDDAAEITPTEDPDKSAVHAEIIVPELKEKEIIIRDNQKGISYKKLFGDYLKGATEITLIDPYIRHPHQFRNLLEFCSILIQNKKKEEETSLRVVSWNDLEYMPISTSKL